MAITLPSIARAETTLGVFAYRDEAYVQAQFEPVADAIEAALPDSRVSLRVLSLNELEQAIAASEIDFILTNPRHFLAIRQKYRVSGALATLQKPQGGHMLSALAGVILARAKSPFTTLADLKGQPIAIPGKRFLGGFLTQGYEIKKQGYDPQRFAEYVELGSHDAVMQALADDQFDAGFVRTGILEDWLASGKIQPGELRVIRSRSNLFYPLAHSTRLYPEWALAAMQHVPMEDIRRVSNALLSMDDTTASAKTRILFDPPQDYLPVEVAARALGMAPFARASLWQQLRDRYGQGVWVFIGLSLALVATAFTLLYLYVNKARLFRRFNALFYFSPSAKLLLREGPQGIPVISEANYAAASLFGFSDPVMLKGASVDDLSPETQPDGQHSFQKAAKLLKKARTSPQKFFWEFDSKGNGRILSQATLIHLKGDKLVNKVARQPLYLVALQDITQQTHDREALEEERNALQNILWGTAAGTWEWNVQTGETRFNERWAEMVGYRLEELEPTTIETWLSFCHPDDQPRSQSMLEQHFTGERSSYDIEVRMRHKEGYWIWVQDRGRVISRTPAGEPLVMAGTHSDITQRKRAETQVNDIITQMRKHAALLPGSLYQYWQHPDGRASFPYASQGIHALFGVTPDEVKEDASAVFHVIEPKDVTYVGNTIQESMETLTTWRATFRVNHPDGHQLWIEGIATPEQLEDGSIIWHGYLHDVTAEHAAQRQLEKYRKSLERSNLELEHFAYAASHDLRQPLRMVTSYAQLLERHLTGQLDEDGATMLHYMRDGAQRIDGMLLSLLEYSRVGRKGQPMQAMELKDALEEAWHFLKPDVDHIHPDLRIEGQWPRVTASPDEMTRLFQNLLSNALKYRTPDKKVCIRVGAEPNVDKQSWEIRVCDNGIGIAPDQIGRLFQVFQRLHTRQEYEGNGVGLAVCRKIVERHGGRIWAESAGEGEGSCFIFTLPSQNAWQEKNACTE